MSAAEIHWSLPNHPICLKIINSLSFTILLLVLYHTNNHGIIGSSPIIPCGQADCAGGGGCAVRTDEQMVVGALVGLIE
jgi:hypothetical protein